MYVYVGYVVQYLSHVVVTHCVWPVSIVVTLWFLLSLFCGVYTCSCGTSCSVTSVNSTS